LVGASADWIIEKSANFYSATPLQRAIRFSVNPGRGFSFSRVNGMAAGLPFIDRDSALFSQVFSGFTGGGTGSAAARYQKKAAISAKIMERLNGLMSSRRISAFDRERLQSHLDVMSSLRSKYLNPPPVPVSCTVPSISYYNQYAGDVRQKIYNNVNDIITAAFSCDITRVACVYIEDFDDRNTDGSAFHGLSHTDAPTESTQYAAWMRWIGDRVADLCVKLDNILEADGSTMLDNTLVFWGGEISNYWHRGESMPAVLVGSAAGKLQTGYYVDYRQRPFKYYAGRTDFPAAGRPYTQLLCSIMQAVGIQPSEYLPYGENGYFGMWRYGYYDRGEYVRYAATRNDVLPFYFK
jgi:hypothetical protein